jgi:hypothetical protein
MVENKIDEETIRKHFDECYGNMFMAGHERRWVYNGFRKAFLYCQAQEKKALDELMDELYNDYKNRAVIDKEQGMTEQSGHDNTEGAVER